MNFFAKLFGTDKAIDHLINKDDGLLAKAGKWVGTLNYTEQEKAQANAETRKWGLRQLEALAPFKVMQRIMVTIIMVEWALLLNTLIVTICLEMDKVIVNLMSLATSNFAWMPVAGAIGLYLFGGVLPHKGKSK